LPRTGYAATFLDRQIVLRILFEHIQAKERVLLHKRVDHVEYFESGVCVVTTDGSIFKGDIVVGGDGVYSKVRQEMWRVADRVEPGYIPATDKKAMFAEYRCLFGIASRTNDMPGGYLDITYKKDTSTFVITGKEGRVYFFIFDKLPKRYVAGDIPKFTDEDALQFGESVSGMNIHCDAGPVGSMKFGEIWKNRITYSLVALEEARYQRWTWGRFVCLGDSIHKMTPNTGAGGNAAIESAAALANVLKDMKDSCETHPSLSEVRSYLNKYQESREARTTVIMKTANKMTRVQALESLADRILAFLIMPNMGEYALNLGSSVVIGAESLSFLPPPERSLKGTMPFNRALGIDKQESRLRRAYFGLPFLALSVIAFGRIMPTEPALNWAENAIRAQKISWDSGSVAFQDFYSIGLLNALSRNLVVFFSPWLLGFDSAGCWQTWSFLIEYGVLYAVLLVESNRRANAMTVSKW
jgi:2-polyprenyl-6-methoxyphenol hydroxylase-like FAD-dependent oxidoreductase